MPVRSAKVGSSAKAATQRPTPADLLRAAGRRLPDVLAPSTRLLFCGINPSLYSAAVGHHFARPGNRFWKALHAAALTRQQMSPDHDARVVNDGLGLTNLVARATASADELSHDELVAGAEALARKIAEHGHIGCVAFLGIGAYRTAFARPGAGIGRQAETLAGARIWLLPNPSGLNAHYQLPALAAAFAELRAETITP